MKTRTLFLLLIILGLIWLFKPANAWAEARRMWAQRELMLRTLVVVIVLYLLYGVYELYQRGWLTLGE
jgi:hypothetical protein